jgi:hypothetical protein
MIRFLRLVLVIVTCVCVIIGVVRQVSITQASPLANLFSNADGSPCQMPCMFGVRPGITKFDAALSMLKTHPLAYNLNIWVGGVVVKSNDASHKAWIIVEKSTDGFVDTIGLNGRDLTQELPMSFSLNPHELPAVISFNDLVSYFGSPVGVDPPLLAMGIMSYGWVNPPLGAVCVRPFANLTQEARLEGHCPTLVLIMFRWRNCSVDKMFFPYRKWLGFTNRQRYAQTEVSQITFRRSEIGSVPCIE